MSENKKTLFDLLLERHGIQPAQPIPLCSSFMSHEIVEVLRQMDEQIKQLQSDLNQLKTPPPKGKG